MALDSSATQADGVRSWGTLVALCPVCESDEVEPVAVGEVFDRPASGDTLLVTRCGSCTALYLNPPPRDAPAAPPRGSSVPLPRAALVAWTRAVPEGGAVLIVGGDERQLRTLRHLAGRHWQVERVDPDHEPNGAGRAGRYDGLLLVRALERWREPVRRFEALSAYLRPGGTIVVVGDNPASPSFSLFGGRHWAGYRFPQHRQVLGLEALRLLAGRSGWRVRASCSLPDPETWRVSALQLLADWRSSPRIPRGPTLLSAVLGSAARVVEALCQRSGRGALLSVTFERAR